MCALGRSRANIPRFFGAFAATNNQLKTHPSPEPTEIAKVGPNVAFIQGLLLFSTLLWIASMPKKTLCGPPSILNFFQKKNLGGTGGALGAVLVPFEPLLGALVSLFGRRLATLGPILGSPGPAPGKMSPADYKNELCRDAFAVFFQMWASLPHKISDLSICIYTFSFGFNR